jgi:hypothetical protein
MYGIKNAAGNKAVYRGYRAERTEGKREEKNAADRRAYEAMRADRESGGTYHIAGNS